MLVYYFVPFIVSNLYLLFWVSNGHNSVTVQNQTHVYMNFFDHKDLGNHLLQFCPKVVKQPVYVRKKIYSYVGYILYIHVWLKYAFSSVCVYIYISQLICQSRNVIMITMFQDLGHMRNTRGADKSWARPGKKQSTAKEDFEFHISYL